jgi:HNH endonuclease
MKDQIKKIRELLDELESSKQSEEPSFKESFQLFELPEIVGSIVDYLQPNLRPYEAAIYWHLFRHSIVATGDVFVRASVRGMQKGIISSMRSGREGNPLSYGAVQDSLTGLVNKGAISTAGDTNNEGTLYRVHLPEEVALCREAMSKAQQETPPQVDTKREVDFYNIKENRLKLFERDKYLCHHCGKQLTRFSATLDHLQPVSEGGDNSYGNLITACLQCNSQRGSQPLMDFLTRQQAAQKQ